MTPANSAFLLWQPQRHAANTDVPEYQVKVLPLVESKLIMLVSSMTPLSWRKALTVIAVSYRVVGLMHFDGSLAVAPRVDCR